MDNELSVIAKKAVLEGFLKNEDMLSQLSSLEVPLKDFIGSLCPSARDYEQRRDLIRIFNEIAKEIYGFHRECPVVQEFGSFLMDIFDPKSDLDLSINFSDKKAESQRDIKIKTLRQFGQKLRALQKTGHVTNVQSILSARVPVLKVTDCGSGIECDLSVGNLDGIIKSHIIQMISDIDERFRKLSILMKAWAKAHDINCSKEGTLNSLSLILLAIFHLQTRNPPVFPPLSSIFEGGTDPKAVEKIIPKFKNYGMKNKESVAELFVSLLIMLKSVETLWPKGLCVSVFEGSWVYKQWKTKKGGEKIAEISIEDFPERSENTARVVTTRKMRKINMCIQRSLQQIQSFVDGNISTAELMNSLFGVTSKKRKRKPKGKGKGKDSKKPHENHRLPSLQQANRVDMSHETGNMLEKRHKGYSLSLTYSQKHASGIDRSHEITSGTQCRSSSHSSSFDQGSTTGAPYCLPYNQDSKKPYESHHLQPTSFQMGPSMVDMSYSLNGGIQSSNIFHYNHFDQGPTTVEPHAMPFSQVSSERGIGRDTKRPREYYRHLPSTSSQYQASMVDMSHRPHEYYRHLPSTSSHYQASTVGMSHEILGGIQTSSFTQDSLERRIGRDSERSREYYRCLPPSSSQYQTSMSHEIIQETQRSHLSHYNHLKQVPRTKAPNPPHFDQRPMEVHPQHVQYRHEAQQVYHQHPRSQYHYTPLQSRPPYYHRKPSERDADVIAIQRAPRR